MESLLSSIYKSTIIFDFSFVSYNHRVMTLTKAMPIHFQYMKVSATTAEDLTRHSLLPTFRATGYHFMALPGPKGLSFPPQCWTSSRCRCSAPWTAGLCSCLWSCFSSLEGFLPQQGHLWDQSCMLQLNLPSPSNHPGASVPTPTPPARLAAGSSSATCCTSLSTHGICLTPNSGSSGSSRICAPYQTGALWAAKKRLEVKKQTCKRLWK